MLGLRFESEETVAGRGGVGIEAFLSRSRSRRCWNGAGLNGAGLRVRGGAGSCVGAGWVQGSSRHGEGRDATGVGGRGWAIVAVVGQSRGRGNRAAIADRHRHGPRHRPARIPGGAPPGRAAPTPAPWQSRTGIDTAIARQSRTGIDIGTIAGSRGRVSRSRTGIDTAPGIDQPKSPAARHQAGPPLPPPRVLAPRGRSASGRSIAGFSARRLRRGLRRRFGRFLARRRRSLVDLGEVVVGQ